MSTTIWVSLIWLVRTRGATRRAPASVQRFALLADVRGNKACSKEEQLFAYLFTFYLYNLISTQVLLSLCLHLETDFMTDNYLFSIKEKPKKKYLPKYKFWVCQACRTGAVSPFPAVAILWVYSFCIYSIEYYTPNCSSHIKPCNYSVTRQGGSLNNNDLSHHLKGILTDVK